MLHTTAPTSQVGNFITATGHLPASGLLVRVWSQQGSSLQQFVAHSGHLAEPT